ncbi:hypothetical protein Y1Q_0022910 [Alligator mississippiensis]|uniref:Uncharacterized protein n=1 Tax=Alligator mississippiensis TaxID=8496 RepID=A0A151MZD0_ALLMI|nr:hypothetical protein Y1Q_0022910 [Alligator mississippiensis]
MLLYSLLTTSVSDRILSEGLSAGVPAPRSGAEICRGSGIDRDFPEAREDASSERFQDSHPFCTCQEGCYQ